jgi:hypothetical protein
VDGSTLNIAEACCLTVGNVTWQAANLGTVTPGSEGGFQYRYGPAVPEQFVSNFGLVYDKGPGPDGIPGCMGDNNNTLNGTNSCNQRLGLIAGVKTNPYYATGQDDRAIMRTVGSVFMPAVGARFKYIDASPATVAHFGLAQNPPTTSSGAAFTLRDLNVFAERSADVLVKVNTTQCPLTATGPACEDVVDPCGGLDADGDLVCDGVDNCPTIANPGQENGGGGLEVPVDNVGDACDNCVRANNPRVSPDAATYLTANPWRTLTGGQIDDDNDGYGNRCDAKFVGLPTAAVGSLDLGQFRTSSGEDRRFDTCGTVGGSRPCAIYDLDEAAAGNSIGSLDLGRFRALSGSTPGPRCAACTGDNTTPLVCQPGTAGSCVP